MPPPNLTRAVAQAVARSPGTLRALARAAGVPASTLARIGTGEREATREVAAAVGKALARWSRECARLAARIEAASTPRRI
ncbi:MAG TPA: helix-turn-helix transcriptional regulator [Gemmatimonadales bacterium]|jgi:plasmid maintenance system antidote protein VapI|nr:helix-turn-helix transcriptional regulator [Gemmatimonadales bacterium]